MIVVIILLILVIIFLIYKLHDKQIIDTNQRDKYNTEIRQLSNKHTELQANIKKETQNYNLIREQLHKCNQQFCQMSADLENHFYELREQRTSQLNKIMEAQYQEKQKSFELQLKQQQDNYNKLLIEAKNKTETQIEQINNRARLLAKNVSEWEQQYNNLLAPLQLLEKERMEKFFYTVQIPEEYHSDIQYLLTVVSSQVKHPDIINKLIWQEYIKSYLDDTFKRIEIKDQPGIYKITNIQNGKSYVGKSTNVKKRIIDHFKGAIGIQTIADQLIHHEMRNMGLWNWTIEVIGYFSKEELSEKQKFYIDKFKANQYGYNKRVG